MKKHSLTAYNQGQSPAAQMWFQLRDYLNVLREVWKLAIQTNTVVETSSYFPVVTLVSTVDFHKAS